MKSREGECSRNERARWKAIAIVRGRLPYAEVFKSENVRRTVYRAEGKERPMSTDVSVFDRQKAAAFGLVLKVLQSVFGAEPSVGQVNALREERAGTGNYR